MMDCVQDFLNLSLTHQPKIAELLYQHCLMCCESTSYGFAVPDHETETEANLRNFGVHNAESALRKNDIDSIIIDKENDAFSNRYVAILFYPEWEKEHGCTIVLQNGVPIDYQEGDAYMAGYEESNDS